MLGCYKHWIGYAKNIFIQMLYILENRYSSQCIEKFSLKLRPQLRFNANTDRKNRYISVSKIQSIRISAASRQIFLSLQQRSLLKLMYSIPANPDSTVSGRFQPVPSVSGLAGVDCIVWMLKCVGDWPAWLTYRIKNFTLPPSSLSLFSFSYHNLVCTI